MHGSPQPSPVELIWDYDVRLIVAGTRGYNNYREFSELVWEYLKTLDSKSVIFISGAAKSGADALIIRFCKEHGKPWVEFPADWDKLGKRAGYARNTEMAKVGTHLLTFYDGFSRGTRHMLEEAKRLGLQSMIMLIDILKTERKNHVRERTESPSVPNGETSWSPEQE